jgi:hypothetical protein
MNLSIVCYEIVIAERRRMMIGSDKTHTRLLLDLFQYYFNNFCGVWGDYLLLNIL